MPLVAYSLVTLANTKTFLGILNNEKDAVLEMLINMATDYIESQTGRRFVSTVHTQEEYDGTGTYELSLKAFPIITFTKLEFNNASDNSDDWEDVDAEDYWVDTDTGIVTMITNFDEMSESLNNDDELSKNVFFRGKNRYRVTYTSGYSTVPYDLQYACMSLVGQLLTMKSATGIKSESLGDHSVTFQDVTDLGSQSMFSDIINKYRDIPLA